jgi:hypothetical protein
MSDTQQTRDFTGGGSYPVAPGDRAPGWTGFVTFSGIMMILLGGFQATEGLVALFDDRYYLVTSSGLLINVDYTAWGWVHLLIGLVALAAGIGVLFGQMWARVVGIIVAAVSALANLVFLPSYPVWCAIVIALDVLVIYALAVHGGEVKSAR